MSVLKRLALNDEGFVFDPATGDSYLLNPTAGVLVRGIQEGVEEADLWERLVDRFEIDREQASSDVDDFLIQLRALRLL